MPKSRTLLKEGPMSAAVRAVLYSEREKILAPIQGFSDGIGCGGGLYVVDFNKPVIINNHTGAIFFNATTSQQATLVTSTTLSGESTIEYTVTWTTAPVIGDKIEMIYIDIFGSYEDESGVPMADKRIEVNNCLNVCGPGFFQPSTIYDSPKLSSVSGWRVQKMPVGANAVWLRNNGVNMFIGWGSTEEEAVVSQGLHPGGTSRMYFVPHEYFGWFSSGSQLVNMAFSVTK